MKEGEAKGRPLEPKLPIHLKKNTCRYFHALWTSEKSNMLKMHIEPGKRSAQNAEVIIYFKMHYDTKKTLGKIWVTWSKKNPGLKRISCLLPPRSIIKDSYGMHRNYLNRKH